ncbi:MAG: DUF6122 family protein [Flavobacteriaceae bacterium]|nr:DUF6122 family protein [Flavobacteriaceae bacterium]
MELIRLSIHYGLHFIFPVIIAYFFFNKNWKAAYFIMLLTMLIDLDHLLATPIFDPNRCSIGFHPLHTYWALAVYIALCFFKRTRVIGMGLVLHLITDGLDCLWL